MRLLHPKCNIQGCGVDYVRLFTELRLHTEGLNHPNSFLPWRSRRRSQVVLMPVLRKMDGGRKYKKINMSFFILSATQIKKTNHLLLT